jgi:uncharacterized Zn finger protein
MAKRSSYYNSYWPSYEASRPIDVPDGIKARSQRGQFVKNWWADRWIKALTPLMDSARLTRGRSYARRGQVINIEITPGKVKSRVQGSRPAPYKVYIELKPLSNAQWEKVLDALAEQAIFAAQLLNGEMPPNIEAVFDTVQVPLFPKSRDDLETNCSCPDWANPCKHVAAVYYLLGERFDQDPFLLFQLRGRSKQEIAAELRERRAAQTEAGQAPASAIMAEAIEVPGLEECLDRYWSLGPGVEEIAFDISPPDVELALLKRLGVPDFQGMTVRTFQTQMARLYGGVTDRALQIAFVDTPPSEAAD